MITTYEQSGLVQPPRRGAVVSVGVFDGVHLGHQQILARNLARARELDLLPTVVTFREHPKTLLLGRSPRTLTSLEHRLELFRRRGIAHTLVLSFDEELRRIEAGEFTRRVLVDGLGARFFVLGFDSKFGRDRAGTPEFLSAHGYAVETVPQVLVRGRAVSSSAIREAVELGDLVAAAELLGRSFAIYGDVVHGDALGRQLGFPTANIDPHQELRPPAGVYACWANLGTGANAGREVERWPAVVNVGFRPTLAGERPAMPRVEAHLLDFSGELYGEFVELEFVVRLREEQRFPDLQALAAQIAQDVQSAKQALRSGA